MEMSEFKSILEDVNEKTRAVATRDGTSWRRTTELELVTVLEILQEREMLVRDGQ